MIACLTSHAESVLSIMQSQLEVGGYFSGRMEVRKPSSRAWGGMWVMEDGVCRRARGCCNGASVGMEWREPSEIGWKRNPAPNGLCRCSH